MGIKQSIRNFLNPAVVVGSSVAVRENKQDIIKKNLNHYPSPVQLQRLRHDVGMWREAINEAELAYFPQRIKMQRLFIDTHLNGHVSATWERRKDLTMLREFSLVDAKGNEIKNDFLNKEWFSDFINHTLDALAYGYSLISLGDVVDSNLPNLTSVRRWFLSPDRLVYTPFIYTYTGIKFMEQPVSDWHAYIKTPSDNGASPCGYGLFYKIAIYEIFLRNLLGFNGDFVELYAQPYRVGTTSKSDEGERAEFAATLQQMGSAGWAIKDPTDEIAFLETALGGTGWKGYENLEQRCEKKISKLILGHSDAMDSTPGKLGAGQNNEESPVNIALRDKQAKDGRFVENAINSILFPKLANLGFNIPAGSIFKFKNSNEANEIKEREDKSNQITANIAQTMKNAGLKMDAKYFSDRTGIPVTEDLSLEAGFKEDVNKSVDKVRNKLVALYDK